DCSGDAVCMDGTCTADCMMTGCSTGTCDIAAGVCTEPTGTPGAGDPYADPTLDWDGDGIPNYLEGDGDADGDGLPNWLDYDSDGDGILDAIEGSGDTDGDGVLDSQDLDSDNDGMPDEQEVGDYDDLPLDSDLDGIPDFQDIDSDNDGIPDVTETGPGGEEMDTDGDGVPNHLDEDSDNDGTSDSEEAGWEPTQPADSDGDGIPDYLDNDRENPGFDLLDTDQQGLLTQSCSQGGGAANAGWLLLLGVLGLRLRRRHGVRALRPPALLRV
ncbi:MAG: thrombospondin type 3 repeat-containing protein, partial [Deltaproteobacteria bacterium]|nr:thrombospondin type 3 repeat-containing protein [Deltaproteobacteria bacterium]